MSQEYEFIAIVVKRDNSGNLYVEAVKPDNAVTVQQGRDAFAAMKELSTDGWEPVTNLTFSDGRPNLILRRPTPGRSADEHIEALQERLRIQQQRTLSEQ